MIKETKLEIKSLLASCDAVNALIETQTILQLLVQKGIVTPEEVASMRNVVKRQPKYNQMLQELDNEKNKLEEHVKFEELFTKSLQPGGKESLTQEEKDYLLREVDKMTKR